MRLLRRRRAASPRTPASAGNNRRLIRRVATLGALGGIAVYRRQRLDAADQAFPQAVTRTP